jgi:hypothetical protein
MLQVMVFACRKSSPLPNSAKKDVSSPPESTHRSPVLDTPDVDAIVLPGNAKNLTILDDSTIIDGYLSAQSYYAGDLAAIYVSATNPHINSYITVYNVNGGIVFYLKLKNIYTQTVSTNLPYANGYDYQTPSYFFVPNLASGVYLVARQIPIIIKSTSDADFTVLYTSNTENAYANSGGKSLYEYNSSNGVRSYQASFLRPITMSGISYGFFKWLLSQKYTYNVICDMDMDDPNSIKGKLLIVCGHGEYWTRQARNNFDNFVNNGNDAILLSGNTMYWQVRYNDTKDQLICYKDLTKDPVADSSEKTIMWLEESLNYQTRSSIGVDFNGGGYGNYLYPQYGLGGYKIFNPQSPLFDGLKYNKGDILPVYNNEYDGAPLSGFDADGYPIINNDLLNFYKVELIGYNESYQILLTTTTVSNITNPTFIICKKTATSGTIVNTSCQYWCHSSNFLKGPKYKDFQRITKNAIDYLLQGKNLFTV